MFSFDINHRPADDWLQDNQYDGHQAKYSNHFIIIYTKLKEGLLLNGFV